MATTAATTAALGHVDPRAVASVLVAVEDAVAWLNAHNDLDDAEITVRVLKVAEETGEAAQAWIGATGQNPRKGITHSRAEVAGELADVVMAALVAIASLGIDPGPALVAKACAVSDRVRAARTSERHRPNGGEAA
jgi:NTP pyrophosphatase (non-canonical NTP hydrolase)